MILTIDLSSKPKLVLIKEKKEITHQWDGLYQLSETLLIEIDKFLKKKKVSLAQIKKINVTPSEESIVSTRIAKATALALMQNQL